MLVVAARWSLLARLAVFVLVALAVITDPGRRAAIIEGRHLTGLWWRYRWSSNASRVGLGADGESSSFEAPELRRLRVDPLGRTYRLRVSRLKLAEIEASAERLRGKWKAHHVLVTVPRPGFVDLRVIKLDPLAKPTPYRHDRPVATLQDGRPFNWIVGDGHTLVAGATGSGKSGILSAIVASFAPRPDVALLAIDLKRVEVAAIRPRCSRVADTLPEAHALLTWLVQEMERRWLSMARDGVRSWSALKIVLIIDEFAAVAAVDPLQPDQKQAASEATQRLGLVDAIAARGRAAGIELLICTQAPAAELFGKTGIRANLPRRLIARVVSADQAFVGAGVHGTGAEAIRADRPGTCALIVPGLDGVQVARFAYLSDAAVEQMANRYAHLAPVLPDHDTAGPVDDPTAPPANPTKEDSHNDRREAGATDRPRVYPQGVPTTSAAALPDPLALIPVTDAELLAYHDVRAEQRTAYMELLCESSGQSLNALFARLGQLTTPELPPFPIAGGESLHSGPHHPTPANTTHGQHPPPLTADSLSSSDPLIVPHADPRRTNPATGRPYPASYRKRWPDGTLRNYPEPAE